MSTSLMGHNITQTTTPRDTLGHSTLDPAGTQTMVPARLPLSSSDALSVTNAKGYARPVRVLIRAPFQYKYGTKSYWVTTGEWYSLDPIKDRDEILFLDSPSNPYREFMYMEGHEGVGTSEDRGDAYVYGSPYQRESIDVPVLRNSLLPSEEPQENPHILEILAKAGLDLASPSQSPITPEEVIPPIPDSIGELPLYEDVEGQDAIIAPKTVLVEGTEPIPSNNELREAELRAMNVSALKALASTLGITYTNKEATIQLILAT